MINVILTLMIGLLISCSPNFEKESAKGNKDARQLSIQEQVSLVEINFKKLSPGKLGFENSFASKESEHEYYEVFPDSFEVFNAIFGATEKEEDGKFIFNPAPLYDSSYFYIKAFFELLTIEKHQYYNRMITICVEAEWDVDAVNYFQHGTQAKVKNDLSVFCELLSKLKDEEIKHFWHFYFDGPHPEKDIPNYLQEVKQLNDRTYTLMKEALEEVNKKWKDLH